MKIFFTTLGFMLCLILNAQRKTIYGLVLDSSTYAPLKNVYITNLATNKKTTVDDNGKFSLTVGIGDVVFVTAERYHFKAIQYNIMLKDTLYIYLALLPHELPGVTVQAAGYSKYQQDSMKRLAAFKEDIISPSYKPVTKAHSQGFGLGISLDFLSKQQTSKRRQEKFFEQSEKDAYVNYRFSPEIVGGYTGLKGDSLTVFIQKYAPDYTWLREHTSDEDVFYYINDKLKIYLGRK